MKNIVKKKKSLLFIILDNLPVRTQLGFGIHENVLLTKVDIVVRKNQGQIIDRNTFLTFTKYNQEEKAIAQTEFSYWNLQYDNDFVLQNLVKQVSNLIEIVTAVTQGQEVFDPFTEAGYESYEELKNELATKKGAKKIQDSIMNSFYEIIKDYIGKECPVLRLKVVTTFDGLYTDLPNEGAFIEICELNDSQLSMSSKDMRLYDKGLSPKHIDADNKTTSKDSEKPKDKKALMNI